MTPSSMTLSDLQGHSRLARLFK